MNCPVCNNVSLVMSDRQGVEIDYCPQCRGVWLDRGELDKIIERSTGTQHGTTYSNFESTQHDQHDHDYKRYEDHHDYEHGKHRKRSFLEELFD